ncbi:MAG: SAM-dependent methyltransferase [Verrucomicrobia bacterium]|jgi:SAM-dependent methyltransferase|nr:SAM-dependent methyltransferase [Verrucomicrobiota bacterium]
MNPPNSTEKFLYHLRQSLEINTFASLQLTGAAQPDAAVQQVDARLVLIKGQPHLSFISHEAKRDVTRNLALDEGIAWIRTRLEAEFRNGFLRTSRRNWQWHRPAKGQPRLVGHKPTVPGVPSREHDLAKHTLLDQSAADWLHALGVLDNSGRPKPSMTDKYRQISHYLEILHHLARDCGWTAAPSPEGKLLKLADMGCGKGYLTFAAWHLFRRILHQPVLVLGVENRRELLKEITRVAERLQAEGLEFIPGDIATVQLPKLDVLIALHACNTATDDAIRRGIRLGARLIVVAPCCHQALRPELGHPELLTSLLRHGLFKERLAEWLTDGLRTLHLEWAGYDTKVIEFVGSEHTPKNLMIAAVRQREPFSDPAARQRILALKEFFGIQHHALDGLLE